MIKTHKTNSIFAKFLEGIIVSNGHSLHPLVLMWDFLEKQGQPPSPLKAVLHRRIVSGTELHFHDNIAWLLLVVDKIETLGYQVSIKKPVGGWYMCEITSPTKTVNVRVSKPERIDAIYEACYKFLT